LYFPIFFQMKISVPKKKALIYALGILLLLVSLWMYNYAIAYNYLRIGIFLTAMFIIYIGVNFID